MPTLFDLAAANREGNWKDAGVTDEDIAFSRLSGIDGRDVRTFKQFSGRDYALIMRCPKAEARIFHGVVPPKPKSVDKKTSVFGVGTISKGDELQKRNSVTGVMETVIAEKYQIYVSDYDMMCMWWRGKNEWVKLFVSAKGGEARGPFEPRSRIVVKALNGMLVSRLQHGCQDDYHSVDNPGVKAARFAAFVCGKSTYLADGVACKQFYGNLFGWIPGNRGSQEKRARGWFYDANGNFDDTLLTQPCAAGTDSPRPGPTRNRPRINPARHVHSVSAFPSLSLNAPMMIMMRSISIQMPSPPSVNTWSIPVPIFPT